VTLGLEAARPGTLCRPGKIRAAHAASKGSYAFFVACLPVPPRTNDYTAYSALAVPIALLTENNWVVTGERICLLWLRMRNDLLRFGL
jgi:hypothetical protein